MRKLRTAAVVFAVAALASPALVAAASGSSGRVVERRSVDLGRAASAPRHAGLGRLGGLTGRELKYYASQHLQVKNGLRYLHSLVECQTTAPATPADFRLDCDSIFPNNEPDIEVDPLDPMHIVASSNDYDSCCDGFYTSFDGGQTWAQGNMSAEDDTRTGSDPVTVFEPVSGNVIHSSLNFQFTSDGLAKDGDLVVSISTDGGVTWGRPVEVADGQGNDEAPTQLFHDKEWMVVDDTPSSPFYGRTYLTWSGFVAHAGTYAESAIYEAHSDDGGRTWTDPQEISGSAPFCDIQYDGPAGECDENQFSNPTVAPDGTVYVAFENEQNSAIQEPGEEFGNPQQIHDNMYLVVRSTDGGATWSAPMIAATLEDGPANYPVSVSDRQTLSGYQVRVNSAGNIVADSDGSLYLVWSDNRNGTVDATNTDVFISRSINDGVTWTPAVSVDTNAGDQWFPWVDVDPTSGNVAVVYHTRNDPNPHLYNTAVAEGTPGLFTVTVVSTKSSDPTRSVFFKAKEPGCFSCATFMGDYNRLAYGPDGTIHAGWTDFRRPYPKANKPPQYLQFVFYTQLP